MASDGYVLDIGSLNTYWGYAGDEEPRQQLTSAWCYNKIAKEWTNLPADFLDLREEYQPYWTNVFGSLPEPLRTYSHQTHVKGDMVDESPPIKNCSVNPKLSKGRYQKTLQYLSSYHHDQCLRDRPLLVSQPTKCPAVHTRALAEVAFERLDVGAFYAMRKASLAAMAMGRPTACVVELGPFSTTITPVFEGYHLEKNMQQYAVGGLLQEWMLATATRLWQSNAFDPQFQPFSEMRRGRHNFGVFPIQTTQIESIDLLSGIDPSYVHHAQRRIIQDLKETVLRVNEYKPAAGTAALRAEHPDRAEDIPYELPDGKIIYVPETTARDVAEFLLTPTESPAGLQCLRPYEGSLSPLINGFPGISVAVISGAFKAHVDIRNVLLQNVVVAGGCSAPEGLIERVASDLNARSQVDVSLTQNLFGESGGSAIVKDVASCKFKVASQPAMERKYTTWVGGSVMSSLSSFRDVWVSREEWADSGPSILERRKLFA